jgi:hypothetical protein
MNYPSVEQGCMQVFGTQTLMQTPLHLRLLPSTMFKAVLVPQIFFGNVAWKSRSRLVSSQST